MQERKLYVNKGRGFHKGIYFVKPRGSETSYFQTTSLAEANKYVALDNKRSQLKKQLDNINNQIYNMKEDLSKVVEVYKRNRRK